MHRWYGQVHRPERLTHRHRPGELIALLGPSGCGKTTALRALGGLDDVDQGRILVDGKDITDVRRTSGTWASSSRPTACSRT
jgi:putative spermidine/putrescine transport system ATP-binding protein